MSAMRAFAHSMGLDAAKVNALNATTYRIVLNGRAGVFVCVVSMLILCLLAWRDKLDAGTAGALAIGLAPIFTFLANNNWADRKQFRDKRETHEDYKAGKAMREQQEAATAEYPAAPKAGA